MTQTKPWVPDPRPTSNTPDQYENKAEDHEENERGVNREYQVGSYSVVHRINHQSVLFSRGPDWPGPSPLWHHPRAVVAWKQARAARIAVLGDFPRYNQSNGGPEGAAASPPGRIGGCQLHECRLLHAVVQSLLRSFCEFTLSFRGASWECRVQRKYHRIAGIGVQEIPFGCRSSS